MNEVLSIYAYIYMKIKDNSKTSIINVNQLKEIIKRIIYRRGGIPKFIVKEVVEDLIKLGLLERMNFNTYKINEDIVCYKKIKSKTLYFC